jgi:hypothetical protein
VKTRTGETWHKIKSVRFTDDDWKLVEAAAKKASLEAATYMRVVILKAARKGTAS